MAKNELQNIGIITKSSAIDEYSNVVKKVYKELTETHHRQVRCDMHAASCLQSRGYTTKDIVSWANLIITLGGDGTILKVAREIELRKILVLGINFGTLGFLTELPPKQMSEALHRILEKNRYVIDERFLLRVTVYRNAKKIWTSLALNDAVINQGGVARLIRLKTELNRRKVNVFRADGLIVATPTGSTGHALSAGGPIVHPKLPAFIIAPICPASLANRPIVIPNDRQITIVLETQRRYDAVEDIGLTLDGQVVFQLNFGDEIKIRTSMRRFYLVRLTAGKYYKMLRSKLHWGRFV